MSEKHTPGPWYVGAQNDALFIVAGRAPAQNNDHPWHDAPRVAVAKLLAPQDGDELPVSPSANARLIAAAPDLLDALQYVMVAHGEQLTDAFDAACRAIAKATTP